MLVQQGKALFGQPFAHQGGIGHGLKHQRYARTLQPLGPLHNLYGEYSPYAGHNHAVGFTGQHSIQPIGQAQFNLPLQARLLYIAPGGLQRSLP